jgi:peptide/nickel transport system substrate-binding protein
MPKSCRVGAVIAALVLCAVAGVSCSAGVAPQRAASTDLVVARADDVTTLDSDAVSTSRVGAETLGLIAETLYALDPQGALRPALAQRYTVSDDGLAWTFVLREGSRFSTGAPVTAADVRFTVEHAQRGALQGELYRGITSIETPDDRTVVLRTDKADSGLLYELADFSASVIPKDFGGLDEQAFWRRPVGSGPFMIDQWELGRQLRLVPNPHHQGPKPALTSLTFHPVPDAQARMLQLRNGQADLVDDVPYAQVAGVQADPALRIVELPSTQAVFLTLNTTKPPFDDRHARRAVSLAIDRDQVVRATLLGHGEPAGGFLTRSGLRDEAAGGFGTRHDLAAAQEELAQSGRFSFELMYDAADPRFVNAVQVIQAELAELGVTVTLRGADADSVLAAYRTPNWNAGVAQIVAGGDPGYVFQFYVATNGFGSGSALIPEVQRRWQDAKQQFDEGSRLAAYRDLAALIAEDAPQIGLFATPRLYATRAGVQSVELVDPTGALDFTKIVVKAG